MSVNASVLQTIQQDFMNGRRLDAIAACKEYMNQAPDDMEAKWLCGSMLSMSDQHAEASSFFAEVFEHRRDDKSFLFDYALCEKELGNFEHAAILLKRFTTLAPKEGKGFVILAHCLLQQADATAALKAATKGAALTQNSPLASLVRGRCFAAQSKHAKAIECYTKAFKAEPGNTDALLERAKSQQSLGKIDLAVRDLNSAFDLAPGNESVLKDLVGLCMETGQELQALEYCDRALVINANNITARIGRDWALSQLAPVWHIPMMNEQDRNGAYHEGIKLAAPKEDELVFEIGTGSGLLSMMAARLGAGEIVTCETMPVVADVASKVIEQNGFANTISVVNKLSNDVKLGDDLPRKADVLVHEIFSSELLSEHVLPAIEDAKQRLLKPDARIVPGRASVMVALVGGDNVANNVFVEESFGFDLSEFNKIQPLKTPLFREDLIPTLLSEEQEAFSFDFQSDSHFPPESKNLTLKASQSGTCFGLIQWIRIDFGEGVSFENHPQRPKEIANWQHMIYKFRKPVELAESTIIHVRGMHDRSRFWFDLIQS